MTIKVGRSRFAPGGGHGQAEAGAQAEVRGPGRVATLEGSPGAAKLLEKRLALPVREVAALLGISTAAVRHMIAKGDLPGRKIGIGTERVTYIVPTGALLSWLEGARGAVAEGVA